MTPANKRIEYIKSFMTFTEMSNQSKIPASTLSAVMKGTRKLPEIYRKDFRNLFQRTAYADMRAQGLSPIQAKRFSWYSSTRVGQVVEEVGDVVNRITDSRIKSFIESQKIKGTYTSKSSARKLLEASIRDAISRSDLPEERIQAVEYTNTKNL